MLISHDHRFLFVHVPKTAGLSVSAALEPYSQVNNRTGLRRFLSHLPVPEDPQKVAFRVHVTARWIRLKLPRAMFDGYLKFAVVRNPYDRAVSYFHYLTQRTHHHRHDTVREMTFPQFLDYVARRGRSETQMDCIDDGQGNLLVDRLLRIERLNEDFAELCRDLGVPKEVHLPKHNTSHRGGYLDHYRDEGVRRQVEALFKIDFDGLGYSTDPNVREAIAAPRHNPRECAKDQLA